MKKIFSFWRVVISIAWSSSWTWTVTTEKEQRTFLLSLNIIERNNHKSFEMIIGPLKVLIGFIL